MSAETRTWLIIGPIRIEYGHDLWDPTSVGLLIDINMVILSRDQGFVRALY